jgi:hypothetical protein
VTEVEREVINLRENKNLGAETSQVGLKVAQTIEGKQKKNYKPKGEKLKIWSAKRRETGKNYRLR